MSKETKLLFENWRAFLNEEVPTNNAVNQVSRLISLPYVQFVSKFKQMASDPRIQAVIKAGLNDASPKEDDQINVQEGIGIPVIQLSPTQNEVVFDKSLGGKFGPLQNVGLLEKMLAGGDVIVPAAPGATKFAVTAEKKYIVDGHHRWSSLFCINPKANIVCIDLAFKTPLNPLSYLKITQMAIAADIGKIPSAKGGGVNLFKVDENYVNTEVPKQIAAGADKEKIMQVFAKYGHKDMNAINKFIWTNIQQLQQRKPVAGAPPRMVMPQTDPSKGFANKLKTGLINFARIKSTPTTKDK